jgi:hypothetical protein
MGSRLAFAALTAVMVAPACVAPLQAQRRPVPVVIVPPLTALALNDLSFGTVLLGIPVSVSTSDPRRSGQFEVRGPADASVRVEFILPPALVSGLGAMLPIAFGPSDGLADFSHDTPPRSVLFDPHMPLIGTLGPNGMFLLRLGGTVTPSSTQAGGAYSATISLTVYNLGS